jgi:hypothetical protein
VVFARADVVRFAVVRFAVARLAVARFAVDPELVFFDALELAFDREFVRDAADAFRVSAVRSLSKSLSACLFVFAASRRSAVNVAVTSL